MTDEQDIGRSEGEGMIFHDEYIPKDDQEKLSSFLRDVKLEFECHGNILDIQEAALALVARMDDGEKEELVATARQYFLPRLREPIDYELSPKNIGEFVIFDGSGALRSSLKEFLGEDDWKRLENLEVERTFDDERWHRGGASGFVLPLIPILVILIFAAVAIVVRFNPKGIVNILWTPTPFSTPTSSPTPTPTPSPTPTATAKVTPSTTPKPTAIPVSGPPGAGYSTITVATEKGNFSASVLSIDLTSARMITDTGNDSECTSGCAILPLADYVNRNGGFAGVNGTYFCPAEPAYSYCGAANNYDFPVWSTRLSHWINGGNLSWNGRAIFYFDGSGAHYLQNASNFGGGLSAGIVNSPGLLDNGNVQIDDNQSGLSDKQKASGTKVGIGLRDSKNIMVVIGHNVTMQQFAYVFKALSAKGALNLDTGGSTALYYNGRYLAGPGRSIPNAIIFAR